MVDLMGRLYVDLFLQTKFLIKGVDVKIRLVRSKSAFALMAGGNNPNYRINIVNATLFTKKATLNPTLQIAHIKALEKSTVKYSMLFALVILEVSHPLPVICYLSLPLFSKLPILELQLTDLNSQI